MLTKATHCWYCGNALPTKHTWPCNCLSCGAILYQNPLPVAVVIVPVDNGVLVVRRGIDPGKGALSLPGGFIELGETWQQASARELYEEAGITVDPTEIREFQVRSAPDSTLLVFGIARPKRACCLPPFEGNEECVERVVLKQPSELAFPLHTQALKDYFHSRATLHVD